MPEPLNNSLTAYTFTDEELRRASVLPELTAKFIQNEHAIAGEKLLSISIDPDKADPKQDYMQQVLFYKGWMAALGFLLTTSENTKDALKQQLEEQRISQQQN